MCWGGWLEEVFISRSFTPGALAAREKFRQALRRRPLFEADEKVLVAVSGGLDSVVLLHLLIFLSPSSKKRLVVAHFNHRLRGRAADIDARFVRKLCRDWGVSYMEASAPRWKTRENLESRARSLRYRFLEKAARRARARKIVVAHHADDQLETFVMRWLQGAGLKGLSGIRPARPLKEGSGIEIVRPLLGVTRKDIAAYAEAFGLKHREDPTNHGADHLRSRLRKLLKRLKAENPNLAERTAVNALFLQADEEALDDQVSLIFQKLARVSSDTVDVPLPKYRLLPDAVRYRLLQKAAQALHSEAYALPAVAVLKADEILRDLLLPSRAIHFDLPAGLKLEKTAKNFVFFRKSPC